LLSALLTLRGAEISYYDISESNIIFDKGSQKFVLVDFNDVTDDADHPDNESRHIADQLVGFLYFCQYGKQLSYDSKYSNSSPFDSLIKKVHQDNLTLHETLTLFSSLFPQVDVTVHIDDEEVTYRNGKSC